MHGRVPRNDHFFIGLGTALIVSFVAYAIFLQLADYLTAGMGRSIAFRPRTLALLAIALNILPLNVMRRTYRHRSIRGLVTGVMVLAALWFYYYGLELLG